MATRGRKPKPPELKILHADRADRQNPLAPPVIPGCPPCPDHLDEVARAKWMELTNQLQIVGTLSQTDSESLALYCSTFSLWLMARQTLKGAECLLVDTAMARQVHKDAQSDPALPALGGVKLNPILSVISTSAGLMARLQAEFGLTPSSRNRVKSSAEGPKDELDEFLKGKKA